jgi:hypothetical protein
MSTPYVYRLTVAVPEALIEAANHLAVAIGESAGDFETFGQADWVDSEGNRYAVASLQCTPTLFQFAGSMLEPRDFAPENWSFELASFAQSKIELWMGEGDIPSADPDKIVGLVMDDVGQALQLLGLERGSEE